MRSYEFDKFSWTENVTFPLLSPVKQLQNWNKCRIRRIMWISILLFSLVTVRIISTRQNVNTFSSVCAITKDTLGKHHIKKWISSLSRRRCCYNKLHFIIWVTVYVLTKESPCLLFFYMMVMYTKSFSHYV